MTEFIKFTLDYPDKIKYQGLNLVFYCGEIAAPLCSDCPNGAKLDACSNHFTKQETEYLIAHHPELFI